MKRRTVPPTYRLRPVRIYRSELDEILELMSTGEQPVEIVRGTCQYTSLDELRQEAGSIVSSLEFAADFKNSPWVRTYVEFAADHTYISGSTPETMIIVGRVRDLLASRQRSLSGWYSRAIPASVVIGMGLLYPGIARLSPAWGNALIPVELAALVAFFVLPLKARIHLERLHEYQNFWKRHQGDIIKGAVGAGLGYLARLLQELVTK